MATKKAVERAVLVTTANKGVFFGYATDTSADIISLRSARCCVKWVGTKGFLGLASEGPNKDCRIGPAADLELRNITSVAAVTPAAVAAWESAQSGAKIAFWRSREDGMPANGGASMPVSPGMVQKEKGPLRAECGNGQLHATLIPPKWKGDRWWVVALLGEVQGDEEKYWALEREILGECL